MWYYFDMSDKFDKLMQIAKFAAERQQDRRQYEFKIFISYVTLLALAIWKYKPIYKPIDVSCWIMASMVLGSYLLYLLWLIRVSTANRNEGYRRDYYLQQAEDNLCPYRIVKKELPNEYREKKCLRKPKINIVPKMWQFWMRWDQLCENWSIMFTASFPLLLVILLIFRLGCWKEFLASVAFTAIILSNCKAFY